MRKSTKVYVYPITIQAAEEGGYFASCPTLQGCHAEGETYGEAIDNIRNVIAEHTYARREAHEPISSVSFQNPDSVKMEFTLPVAV